MHLQRNNFVQCNFVVSGGSHPGLHIYKLSHRHKINYRETKMRACETIGLNGLLSLFPDTKIPLANGMDAPADKILHYLFQYVENLDIDLKAKQALRVN